MTVTNGATTNKPKLELVELNKPVRLTLLKDKPYIGNNNFGAFYLYGVKNDDGVEFSYFASQDIHLLIQEHKLKSGDAFVLKKVPTMNGKKTGSKIEFSIIGEQEPSHILPVPSSSDNLKEVLLNCVLDAADVVKQSGLQFSNDELQKLATTLFIQRAKNV